ncbi:energy-coupling factor ABC transporter ATP-binding protein [Desulfobacterium sp. N47]|uniref:ABC transporter ATP-binding protein n=1 Tax=uncultured Desulfobacterium sp. TaxID=201089 RepID=E1YAE2_9BACT|nr:Putative ABC transporter ATP-binding protein GSU3001 [uncultured Desulfobacterium sp.]
MENHVRLSVKNVSLKYPDGTKALSDISIEIKKGEFAAILGSNGSGKTTLLKIMDGLLKGSHGKVRLDGKNIKELTPKMIYQKIGLVFQNPDDQLFAATLFDDIAFGPINMGLNIAEVKDRVICALKDVELDGLEKKSIHNLSYGQKKRACIAGLLAMGHEILLLDEPTAGLDPMGEYKMMSLLKKLNRENGVTIVMATHSVDLVPLFLSKLYILSSGRIVRSGIPEEVFTAPKEMSEVKLRLPMIAELVYKLKNEDGLQFGRIPLTIGEARRDIIRAMESRS